MYLTMKIHSFDAFLSGYGDKRMRQEKLFKLNKILNHKNY